MDEPNSSVNGWYLVRWKSAEACLQLTGYQAPKGLWQLLYFRSDWAYMQRSPLCDESWPGEKVLDAIDASLHLDENWLHTDLVKQLAKTLAFEVDDWDETLYGPIYQEWTS